MVGFVRSGHIYSSITVKVNVCCELHQDSARYRCIGTKRPYANSWEEEGIEIKGNLKDEIERRKFAYIGGITTDSRSFAETDLPFHFTFPNDFLRSLIFRLNTPTVRCFLIYANFQHFALENETKAPVLTAY